MEFTPIDCPDAYMRTDPRLDELNSRLASRNVPDVPLRPNFDLRSVPTRYVHPMATRDVRSAPKVSIKHDRYVNQGFAPVTTTGPVAGFRVQTESELRNQWTPLGTRNDHDVYVPSSHSDLYRIEMAPTTQTPTQPHPGLFARDTYTTTAMNPALHHVGVLPFHNDTRGQVRNKSVQEW